MPPRHHLVVTRGLPVAASCLFVQFTVVGVKDAKNSPPHSASHPVGGDRLSRDVDHVDGAWLFFAQRGLRGCDVGNTSTLPDLQLDCVVEGCTVHVQDEVSGGNPLELVLHVRHPRSP